MSLHLTERERKRFVGWLEAEASSSHEIAKRLEKTAMRHLSMKYLLDAQAYHRVAGIISSIEEHEVG